MAADLSPDFGPVKRIVTAQGGQVESLRELEDQKVYVACGQEPFRRLPYRPPVLEAQSSSESLVEAAPDAALESEVPAPRPGKDGSPGLRRDDTRFTASKVAVKSRILDNRFFQPPIQI